MNQVDSFQGSADNWNNGIVVSDGGPTGDGDNFLELSSGPMGLKPRLITLNQMQWTGDFAAAGIGSLTMELKNFGTTSLPMRMTIRDVAGNSSVPGYSTTDPYMLPADGQWHLAEFNLTAADMTAVNPSGGTIDPFSYVLMNVAEFRILSSTVPAVVGDMITAQVGIDDITAFHRHKPACGQAQATRAGPTAATGLAPCPAQPAARRTPTPPTLAERDQFHGGDRRWPQRAEHHLRHGERQLAGHRRHGRSVPDVDSRRHDSNDVDRGQRPNDQRPTRAGRRLYI